MLSRFYYSANEFSKSEENDWQVSKRSNALSTAYHPGTSVLNSFWYVLSQVETFLILAQNLLKTINLCCVTHLGGNFDLTCFSVFIRSPWNWALEFTHVISLCSKFSAREFHVYTPWTANYFMVLLFLFLLKFIFEAN